MTPRSPTQPTKTYSQLYPPNFCLGSCIYRLYLSDRFLNDVDFVCSGKARPRFWYGSEVTLVFFGLDFEPMLCPTANGNHREGGWVPPRYPLRVMLYSRTMSRAVTPNDRRSSRELSVDDRLLAAAAAPVACGCEMSATARAQTLAQDYGFMPGTSTTHLDLSVRQFKVRSGAGGGVSELFACVNARR